MAEMMIGTGKLMWSRAERITDRYGTVYLVDDQETAVSLNVPVEFLGRVGDLLATVLETRPSEHIGDLFHGFFPTTPAVGEVVLLGTGVLFAEKENQEPQPQVGLRPSSGRQHFWLHPPSLYRVHNQTVELRFASTEGDQDSGDTGNAQA